MSMYQECSTCHRIECVCEYDYPDEHPAPIAMDEMTHRECRNQLNDAEARARKHWERAEKAEGALKVAAMHNHELQEENNRLKAVLGPCTVCAGRPLPNGKQCVCGGRGGYADEMAGLRLVIMQEEEENDRLKARIAELEKAIRKIVSAHRRLSFICGIHRSLRSPLCRNCQLDARIEEGNDILGNLRNAARLVEDK